ncbi:MAG: Spy/CpxP family protein refolding chaperone [Pedobacter sp.]|uniref:Spy/CpxP family protein refolding chaperone n=1 Tax=Pedobacter sp. TaxID=1411316 RepID=UPI0028075EE8|nr:Spy/CpxP family protein refolding chaperone [Pedobacter sp.]MDQ8003262.1 Spy/CpxP family protein refolding chaperone [Pedobacter sp.]
MKKLMMIYGLLFGMVAFAQAQPGQGRQGGGPGGRMMMSPENRVKQLDEKLKLSDDQKTKLTTIFTEQADAQKKMREERSEAQAGGGDRQAMMEKMQKMRAELETKVNGVLNDEQKKTYKAMLDEQKAEMEKRAKERQERN